MGEAALAGLKGYGKPLPAHGKRRLFRIVESPRTYVARRA